jgi:pimeloyl-ACP methyl ester carboxylesterase
MCCDGHHSQGEGMTTPQLARSPLDVAAGTDTTNVIPAPPAAPPRPVRRPRRRIRRLAVLLTAGLGALVAVSAGANAVLTVRESLAQPYGQLVTLPGGGKVNTAVTGAGEETFVMMPALGAASPVLEFAPLVDDLDDHATVVVVEPFGYGYSDRRTDADRTVENMTTELHQTLTALKVHQPYTLVAHSIGGLYALDYVNRFPGEVRAVVTIDGQVPLDSSAPHDAPGSRWTRLWTTSGLTRWVSMVNPALFVQAPPETYPEPARRQMLALVLRNDSTPAVVEESQREAQNVEAVRGLSFPAELPVLAYVAQGSMDLQPDWYSAHQQQLEGLERSKLIVLDDSHYLYHHHSPEIADGVRAFLDA